MSCEKRAEAMKRSKSARRKRERFDLDIHRPGRRPILAQPVDERAPAPDDSRLVADLEWVMALREGCVPPAKRHPQPR
jgi:hypothetical protein